MDRREESTDKGQVRRKGDTIDGKLRTQWRKVSYFQNSVQLLSCALLRYIECGRATCDRGIWMNLLYVSCAH